MHFLVTRPQEDAATLAARLRDIGHDVTVDPLLTIHIDKDVPLTRARVQALLVTSANGLRALLARGDVAAWTALPLLAVGPTTAALARDAGFADVREAGGDVVSLTGLAAETLDPDGGPLLHLAGTVTAGDLKQALEEKGFWVERAVLYDARAADALSAATADALKAGALDGVLLYSRRSSEIFLHLVEAAGLGSALSNVQAYCLSANAAAPLQGAGFKAIHVASAPNEAELLALIAS